VGVAMLLQKWGIAENTGDECQNRQKKVFGLERRRRIMQIRAFYTNPFVP
jgi:hypothetical protein